MPVAASAEARFESLESAEQWIWQKLARACRDRRSAWRTPILATVGADGAPRARTVVLRALDGPGRRLAAHSDSRSGKIGELAARPAAALTFYDPRDQLQLRVACRASVAFEGAEVDAAWARVPDTARRNYRTLAPPGSPTENESPALSDDGRGNFAMIWLALERLEFLWLAPDRHRRGWIQWDGDDCSGSWLVP